VSFGFGFGFFGDLRSGVGGEWMFACLFSLFFFQLFRTQLVSMDFFRAW